MTASALHGNSGARNTGGSNPGFSNPSGSNPGGGNAISRRLVVAGWLLYALSWLTPSIDGRQLGAVAFVDSVRFGWNLMSTGSILPGVAVMLGWLANFSLLGRIPRWLRILATLAPWIAFAVVLAKLPVRPSLGGRAAFFLYFYPWAAGIALVHSGRFRCALR